jgi:DNA-binding LytR/AlgR family response regulator
MLDALSERLRPASFLEFIQVQHRQDVMLVPVEEILMFHSSEKYTLAITQAEEWVIRTPLKQLESLLDPARFWRVHRNSIVRVGAIARVVRDADGQALIEFRGSTRTAAVSRAYAHRFRQM